MSESENGEVELNPQRIYKRSSKLSDSIVMGTLGELDIEVDFLIFPFPFLTRENVVEIKIFQRN